MTVGELIEMLQEMDEDAEVRFASQPSWPFEYEIKDGLVANDDGTVVYLAESRQLGYLPTDIADQCW